MLPSMNLKTEATVAEHLRAARGADDVMTRLHEGSIAGKTAKIAEALVDAGVIVSEDDVSNVYGDVRFVLASNSRGEPIRVHVKESGSEISVGKVELLEWKQPISDVAEEALSTAALAAQHILDEDFDKALPALEAVAKTLDVKGDLQRRIGVELDIASIRQDRWYDSVVQEHYEGEDPDVDLPIDEDSSLADVSEGLSLLTDKLERELGQVAEALRGGSVSDSNILDAARSVVEDTKHALRALRNVDKTSDREARKVFEAVSEQAPRLVKGARFVVQLVQTTGQEGAEQ